MQIGDRALLWRAKGSHRDAISGLVAVGQIVDECRPEDELSHPEWLHDSWTGEKPKNSEHKAGIHIEEYRPSPSEGMITRRQVAQDPLLARMAIITARVGSNFRVSTEQEQRLLELWRAANDDSLEGFSAGEISASEGRILERIHRTRERNRSVVSAAKTRFKQKHGRLFCELCGFCYSDAYGDLGADFIEAHHLTPVSDMSSGEETTPDDLMMVCANCHRMLHRGDPEQNLETMKKLFADRR
jgi:predicted HNH restriction endonuclease